MKESFIKRFNLASLILIAVEYFIVIPLIIIFKPDWVPSCVRPQEMLAEVGLTEGQLHEIAPNRKFSQISVDSATWYLAGYSFASLDWKNLYPTPNEKIYNEPNHFMPLVETSLFNKDEASSNPGFYPFIANRANFFMQNHYGSEWVGKYDRDFWKSLPDDIRNSAFNSLVSPPLALIVSPLSFFTPKLAMHIIWQIISLFSLFGIIYFSIKIYRELVGRETIFEGIYLLCSSLFFFVHGVNVGNISQFVGFFITLMAYAWIKNKNFLMGSSFIFPVIGKGLMILALPFLVLEKKINWKAILGIVFWTIFLNAIIVLIGGFQNTIEIYKRFITDIIPNTQSVIGFGFITTIGMMYGVYPVKLYKTLQIIIAIFIYFFVWKNAKQNGGYATKEAKVSAIIGVVLCFLIFNNLHWNHYFPLILFLPFFPTFIYFSKSKNFSTKVLTYFFIVFGFITAFKLNYILNFDVLTNYLSASFLKLNSNLIIWKGFVPNIEMICTVFALIIVFQVLTNKIYSEGKHTIFKGVCVFCAVLYASLILNGATIISQRDFIFENGKRLIAEGNNLDGSIKYTLASEMGNSDAQYELAKLYMDENLVGNNADLISNLLLKSSMGGNREAMLAWANCLENGLYTKENKSSAYYWYLQAGFHGNFDGWKNVYRMYPKIPGLTYDDENQ